MATNDPENDVLSSCITAVSKENPTDNNLERLTAFLKQEPEKINIQNQGAHQAQEKWRAYRKTLDKLATEIEPGGIYDDSFSSEEIDAIRIYISC